MKPRTPLPTGRKAPDFNLKVTPDQRMALYNEILPEFQKHNAVVLGISVDNVWCHLAFADDRNLHFPLLSDFHPKGEVSKIYNAYLEDEGESARAIYLIDRRGMIAWGYIAPIGVNPGADGVLQALESLDNERQLAAAK